MKKINNILKFLNGLFCILLILLSVENICAQNYDRSTIFGFKGIPFGTPYEETQHRIYGLKNTNGSDIELETPQNGYLEIPVYLVGNLRCRIGFNFDHKKRFYQFSIFSRHTYERGQDHLDFIENDFNLLNGIFINKYGKPNFCNKFPSKNSLSKTMTAVCEWKQDIIYAITGVEGHLKYENSYRYYSFGRVGDKKLLREYADYIKKEKEKRLQEAISKGVSDF